MLAPKQFHYGHHLQKEGHHLQKEGHHLQKEGVDTCPTFQISRNNAFLRCYDWLNHMSHGL